MKNLGRAFFTISAVLVLASCGGGGGGSSTPTPPPTPPPAPTVSFSADPLSVLVSNATTLTWSSTNASSCSASGAWEGSKETSGSEEFTINNTGDNTFTLACTGSGGTRSTSVTVEGYQETSGVVVDGYLTGANVFIDQNDNFTADEGESTGSSDDAGNFTLKRTAGNFVSVGGKDFDTQNPFDNLLLVQKPVSELDFRAITPVTSVAAFLTDASQVHSILGIDESIDIYQFDPVANKGDGGVNDFLYEKGNQLTVLAYAIQSIANNEKGLTETSQDFFASIAEELDKAFTETAEQVDIEDKSFIEQVLDNALSKKTVELDETNKANVATALASLLPVIQVKASDASTNAIFNFATTTLVTDLQAIAAGTASEETLASYQEDILSYVAEDQNIDQSEIAPEIKAIDDLLTLDEDESATGNVLTNDSYTSNSPIAVAFGTPTKGSLETSGGQFTYTPDEDYNGTDSFSYTITQGGLSAEALVALTINPVADAPKFTTGANFSVAENQKDVTTLKATDADGDEVSYSQAGDDAASFNLDTASGVLTFKEAPDYETKNAYAITATASDGTNTTDQALTIRVTNVNDIAPEFTSEASFSAAENQTAIGTVTATDAEGDSVTFTVSGTELEITSAGVLTFVTEPDYETKTSYSATVTASDGVNSTEQVIAVAVTNVNDIAPEFTSEASFSAAENQTAIGTVTATDAEGDSVTFTVSGTELEITSAGVLTFVTEPDYETKTSYSATVTASDGVNSTEQVIAVAVTNVNDIAPVITSNTTFSSDENQTAIGTVTATDAEGDSITFAVSGNDLAITQAGVLTFITEPDYETKTSYSATVTASDGVNATGQAVTISINNLNDNAPVITSANSTSVLEGATSVITVTATDADGDSISYSIGGSDATSFNINPSTGVISLKVAADYETKTSYSITVAASDGTFSTEQTFTLNITNDESDDPIAGIKLPQSVQLVETQGES